jgi:hypothetical protein
MKKRQTTLLFYDQKEQIIILYGNDDTKGKIEFVKSFLKENFGVDEFEDSFLEIDRLHVKRLMWLLVTLIIEYESLKQNPNEQVSRLYESGESTY